MILVTLVLYFLDHVAPEKQQNEQMAVTRFPSLYIQLNYNILEQEQRWATLEIYGGFN